MPTNIGVHLYSNANIEKMIESSELRKEIISLDKKINSSFRFLLKNIDALTSGIAQKPRKKVGFKRKDQYLITFDF